MAEIPADVVEFMTQSARDHVLQILREPALVQALVEPRIQQMIASGELVPRSRLQLGVGLELGPVGLEQAARALVAAVAEIEMPELEGVAEALVVLQRVLNRIEAPTVSVPAEDEAEEEPDDEPVVEEHHCAVCDDVVDEDQKLASMTRWRNILCKTHHAIFDPAKPLDSYPPKTKRKSA